MPRARGIFAAALALTSLAVGTAPEPVRDNGPEAVVFETPLGPVSFAHGRHRDSLEIECLKCHHGPEGVKSPSCRSCHKKKAETGEGDPPSFYKVKMEFCRGCHLEKKENEQACRAPVNCEQCHDMKKMVR